MASIADFPIDSLTWGAASDKGVFSLMQAKHSKGYIALHLPPATLAFNVEDPKSHYAPRMKLRVTGDLVDWLRALDAKAAASLEEHLKDHPYKPCVQEGSYGWASSKSSPWPPLLCGSTTQRAARRAAPWPTSSAESRSA